MKIIISNLPGHLYDDVAKVFLNSNLTLRESIEQVLAHRNPDYPQRKIERHAQQILDNNAAGLDRSSLELLSDQPGLSSPFEPLEPFEPFEPFEPLEPLEPPT